MFPEVKLYNEIELKMELLETCVHHGDSINTST